MNPSSGKRHIEQWNFVGLGITIVVLVLLAIFVDISSLRAWVEKAGVWGPLIFILLKTSTLVIAPLSGSPLYPAVGLLFGFWPGILYTLIGDMIGVSINFYLSRKFGRSLISRWISDTEEGLLNRIVVYIGDAKGFFHAALTFFVMPELLSYAAGLSKLPYFKFISILTCIGVIPTSILVLFGSLFGPQSQSLWITLAIPVVGSIAVLTGGLLFYKGLEKKWKPKDSN